MVKNYIFLQNKKNDVTIVKPTYFFKNKNNL